MTKNAEQLIETYINLIDNEDWKTFYPHITLDAHPVKSADKEIIGQVTAMLLQSGIDPLAEGTNLTTIPNYYLYGQRLCTQFQIPNYIIAIQYEPFVFTGIDKLTIPENIKYVWAKAFKSILELKEVRWEAECSNIPESCFQDCIKLEDIYLPKHIKIINDNAFKNCYNLHNIYYNGTMLNWANVNKLGQWLQGPEHKVIVKCIDGEIKI